MIKTVKNKKDGYYLELNNGTIFEYVPKDNGNIHYQLIKEWLDNGNNTEKEEVVESTDRHSLMLKGKDYKGYKISFTKDDGDGVVQAKSAFEVGLPSTVLHFECGTNMPIVAEDFMEFALWFMTERNKFFIEEIPNEN